MNTDHISQYYDGFSERQLKTGANERLVSLYKRMVKLGLSEQSKILELGCGVGLFTKLLSKKVKKGFIEAVDLSEESIQKAKRYFKNNNIAFDVADVVTYTPKNQNFDFITLMDVIEHIPLDLHGKLFDQISQYISANTLIVINIPNPKYIEYGQKNHPEKMQIIDQPVEISVLIQHFEKAGLELVFYEKYSIWEVEDYDFLLVRKKREFELKHLADQRTVSKKIKHKLSTKLDGYRYR